MYGFQVIDPIDAFVLENEVCSSYPLGIGQDKNSIAMKNNFAGSIKKINNNYWIIKTKQL